MSQNERSQSEMVCSQIPSGIKLVQKCHNVKPPKLYFGIFCYNVFMLNKVTNLGKLHKVPTDLQKLLSTFPKTKTAWGRITPLSKNEWICWIESAKKPETRINRLNRTRDELAEGKRRPCCWAGCPHR